MENDRSEIVHVYTLTAMRMFSFSITGGWGVEPKSSPVVVDDVGRDPASGGTVFRENQRELVPSVPSQHGESKN